MMEEFNWIHLAIGLGGAVILVYAIKAIRNYFKKPTPKKSNHDDFFLLIGIVFLFILLAGSKSTGSKSTGNIAARLFWITMLIITIVSCIFLFT